MQEALKILPGAEQAKEDAGDEQNPTDAVEIHRCLESEDMDGIGIMDEESDEPDELECGFNFSASSSGDDETFTDCDESHALHSQFTSEDDDWNPRFEPSHRCQLYGSCHDHEFIGEWVEEFSSYANEIETSGEVSVEEVGDGSDGEAEDSQEAEERCFEGEEEDDEGDENDSQERDGIGDIEDILFNIDAQTFFRFFVMFIFSFQETRYAQPLWMSQFLWMM